MATQQTNSQVVTSIVCRNVGRRLDLFKVQTQSFIRHYCIFATRYTKVLTVAVDAGLSVIRDETSDIHLDIFRALVVMGFNIYINCLGRGVYL